MASYEAHLHSQLCVLTGIGLPFSSGHVDFVNQYPGSQEPPKINKHIMHRFQSSIHMISPSGQQYLPHMVSSCQVPTAAAACKSLSNVDPSVGLRWLQGETAAYRSATCLSFKEAHVLAVAVDCARIGKPAREFMVATVSDPSSQRHAVLPPQVG